MSNDGATQGITAERALATILGGVPTPTEDEEQTKEQVRARIETADATSYNGCADCITHAMLRVLEDRPETRDYPLELPRAYVTPESGETIGIEDGIRIVREGTYEKTDWKSEPEMVYVEHTNSLWDAAKEVASPGEKKAMENATGFMAGFAYNQARWLLDLPPAPNPALLEI